MKSETCPRCGHRVGLDSLGRYVKHCAPDSAPYPCSTSGRTAKGVGASEHFEKESS